MLLAMIPYLNGQGEVQASVSALAREIGVSRTTAWRILRDLEERGEIERVETGQWRWKLPLATDGYFNAQAYDTAWRIAIEARLPTSQRLVFLAVASHVNQKGWAWPSVARIARMTGLSRRTVLEALKALSPSYLQPDIKPGPKGTTRYRVATLHPKSVSVLHSKAGGANEGVAGLKRGITPSLTRQTPKALSPRVFQICTRIRKKELKVQIPLPQHHIPKLLSSKRVFKTSREKAKPPKTTPPGSRSSASSSAANA